ncbi:MAG: 6-bladed beta-propeller [Phycisphaerae bacterium]
MASAHFVFRSRAAGFSPRGLTAALAARPAVAPFASLCCTGHRLPLAAVSLLLCAALGCATPQGVLFAPVDTPRVWPAPPDLPRIKYVGEMASSSDLHAGRTAKEGFLAAMRGPRPPIKFSSPQALAVDHGTLLAVADAAGGAVHLVDLKNRTYVVSLGSASHRLGTPSGVAWAGGTLFVTDAQRGEVAVFNTTGRLLRTFGQDDLERPVGIAYLPDRKELVVVDGGHHRLVVFGLDGGRVRRIGQRGSEPGSFNFPTHICQGRGMLVVADSGNFRVQILDEEGRWIRTIGQKGDGAGDFALPKGVAFDSEAHIYVVDAQFENVQVFDMQGRLLMAFGEEGRGIGQFWLPAGLAIDAEDRIWVADSGNHRVAVLQYLGSSS